MTDVAGILAVLEAALEQAEPVALPAFAGDLERLRARCWARLTTPAVAPTRVPAGDSLIGLDEAAARLGVTTGWLKKRPDLPFRVVLSEGTVRYSAEGIGAYIRARLGH